jgi:hypothetical protein
VTVAAPGSRSRLRYGQIVIFRRVVPVLALTVSCAVLAGCGGSDSDAGSDSKAPVILDTKRVERAIEGTILTKRKVTADVDCPAGVHQGRGLTFRCLATTPAGKTTFVVEQQDDAGNVTYAAR